MGERPDASAIRALTGPDGQFSISHDPADGDLGQSDEHWLELLASGLTYDLRGLAPGPPIVTRAAAHRFGLSPDFAAHRSEAVGLTPGPHLSSSRTMLPVLRTLAWLAAQLSVLPGLEAIAWHPARTVCAPDYFRNSVLRWVGGGAFPGLGLAALDQQADGSILSEGLALFTRQELRVGSDLGQDRAERAKIALRLMHWLVENGRVEQPTSLTGPSGETLLLEPDTELGIVSVWRGSR